MAGNKIFVSYKYWDKDVAYLHGYSGSYSIARDYVDYIENELIGLSDHIYKGEHNDEDLSDKSDEYIWEKLKDKIYDSSVTIVLISPNMKEQNKWERNQWIPQEISYSVKEMTRGGYTSRSNAVLGVILPDKFGNYDYYNFLKLFKILDENIGIGYIPVVKWINLKNNFDSCINLAIKAKDKTPKQLITKQI